MATRETAPTEIAPGFFLWHHKKREKHRQPPDSTVNSRDHGGSRFTYPGTSSSPTLVLLFTWLFCKPSSASKYVSLYTSKGCDVLQISSSLSHFLWPPNSELFAGEILRVLKTKLAGYKDFIVHAMSIGAYNYTTCLMQAQESAAMKEYFFRKVRGIVFDSLTLGSLDHMVQGIATGLSQWAVVRLTTKSLANLYFCLTHKTTVQAFNEGVEFFKTRPAHKPTLVFAAKNDPMNDPKALEEMVEDWEVKAIFPVTCQIWEKSGHCAHLIYHENQYNQLLNEFLASLNLNLDLSGKSNVTEVVSKL